MFRSIIGDMIQCHELYSIFSAASTMEVLPAVSLETCKSSFNSSIRVFSPLPKLFIIPPLVLSSCHFILLCGFMSFPYLYHSFRMTLAVTLRSF